MTTKIDDIASAVARIEEKQDGLCAAISTIKQVLGGSGLGDTGLIEQMTALKGDYYKTKSEVKKLKWGAGLLVAAVAGGASYLYKKIFE